MMRRARYQRERELLCIVVGLCLGWVARDCETASIARFSVTRSLYQMSVKLRLTRVGKTKQPQYRIVATDSRSPRDGRFIEIVGQYNPRAEPSVITVDNAKAVKWLMEGAQPSDRVRKLLEISGAWSDFGAARAAAK